MKYALLMLAAAAAGSPQDPLRVCATTPELGALVREIGGDAVALTVFTKPTEDPHFVEAKPSFVKAVSEAEALVVNGLELETGYLPVLLRNSRNDRVLAGAPGYIDASSVVPPKDVPSGPLDRSRGDVHPNGNPHFMLDPLAGLKVAELIRDRLSALRPGAAPGMRERFDLFRAKLGAKLVGKTLAEKYKGEFEKLAGLAEHGKLADFLKSSGQEAALGGWVGRMAPFRGTRAVGDHPMWTYFAERFGIEIVGYLEPLPGITPTTRHLGKLVEDMKQKQVKLIFTSAYYDPKHAQVVAQATGAKALLMANQAGARPGTDDYLGMVEYNVVQAATALEGGR
jgi:ABC-type Zn uptake system ZnuABC Zn-binding protein ZnuA